MLAVEIDSHLANGSEWLEQEEDGGESPAEVVRLRQELLRAQVRALEGRALRIARGLALDRERRLFDAAHAAKYGRG